MIKKIVTNCIHLVSINSKMLRLNKGGSLFINKWAFTFNANKLKLQQIPHQNKQIRGASITLGEQQVDYFKTQGGISILEKILGVKVQSGELYVIKFRCSVCQAQSIRSFTKHSYHKGVVMVRCGICQKIHLVADNIGWFQNNLEKIHEGKVQKLYDPVAIVRFLQAALGVEKQKKSKIKQETNSQEIPQK